MRQPGAATAFAASAVPLRKLLTLLGLSALFLCQGGIVAFGGSAPLVVTAESRFYPTFGSPADTLVTNAGYALVSLTADRPPPFLPDSQAGIQVLQPMAGGGYRNPCGGKKIVNFPKTPSGRDVQSVFGLKFYPASQASVGAAVEAQGGDFFRLASLDACAIDGVVNVQQPPVVTPPACTPPTCAPGSFDVAFTPNGQHAFLANEYGLVPGVDIKGSGTIGVVKVVRDGAGRFTIQTGPIAGNKYIYVLGGGAVPGMTLSHDGARLYVTSEVARPEPKFHNPTLSSNPILVRKADGPDPCIGNPTKIPVPKTANGLLTVIDVNAAVAGKGQAAIIQSIAAGCSPVRVAESANGKTIWVTARASDKILAFDVVKLVSRNIPVVNQSFIGHVDSGGAAPVGAALFHDDQLLAVSNSNRFNVKTGRDNVAIFDVRAPSAMRLVATVPAYRQANGLSSFPRDITLGPDGSTLFVPNFTANHLQIIRTSVSGPLPGIGR